MLTFVVAFAVPVLRFLLPNFPLHLRYITAKVVFLNSSSFT
ncbi:conserved hypothetical protein, partial [Listeria marthii FSL S4-120]